MTNLYKKASEDRKRLQEEGGLPEWITTPSYQMLTAGYLEEGETLADRFRAIAKSTSRFFPVTGAITNYEEIFYDLMWKGWLAPSTPVLSNTGRDSGCSVSCSGQEVDDSVAGFYKSQLETAMLSKNGFGTSAYFGSIRPRGSKINGIKGGASGVLPVYRDFVQVAKDISQGSARRGAFSGQIPIDHPDVPELMNFISRFTDGANICWSISDDFIERLDQGDEEALHLYREALHLKMLTGKGDFLFVDKVNRQNPIWYKNKGVRVKATNLCSEITLPTNEDETFTCIISSLNLSKYDEWKETGTIFYSTLFLYGLALDFIEKAKDIPGLEKAVEFTKNHMALGLGTLGFHTYLQKKRVAFESLEAHYINEEIYRKIKAETERANYLLYDLFGECPMTKGYRVACTHLTAIAPNFSSAIYCGGVSQGISPVYKNTFVQNTAHGDINRINPELISLLKEKELYTDEVIDDIVRADGSIQELDYFTDEEKQVFKTAFEIDQYVLLRLADNRQRYITQSQSVELYFDADEDESVISAIHKHAFKLPFLKTLYYIRSSKGVKGSTGECVACAS